MVSVSRALFFALIFPTLFACDIRTAIVGQGDIYSFSQNHNCPLEEAPCSNILKQGEAFSDSFAAIPREGWGFREWHGCLSIHEDYPYICGHEFTANQNHMSESWTITAYFEEAFTLLLGSNGLGGVESSSGEHDGEMHRISYAPIKIPLFSDTAFNETFTAKPARGWRFTSWDDCPNVEGDKCIVDLPTGTIDVGASMSVTGNYLEVLKLITPEADGGSYGASLSGNGRFIAFSSNATNLLADDTDNNTDIYVYDRELDTLEVLTANANGLSFTTSISSDGRYVVFTSNSNNITAEANGEEGVYLHDRNTHTTSLIAANSSQSDISGNGRYITFHSRNGNLDPDRPSNHGGDLYLFDRINNTTTNVTPNGSGTPWGGILNEDGSYIVFTSDKGNIAPNAAPNGGVFLYSRATDTISFIVKGGATDISSDGRYLVFISTLAALDPSETDYTENVFVFDRTTEALENITNNGDHDSFEASISDDGRYVSFQTRASNLIPDLRGHPNRVFVYDRQEAIYQHLTPIAKGSRPTMSGDGMFVAFESSSRTLIAIDSAKTYKIFLYDRTSGL